MVLQPFVLFVRDKEKQLLWFVTLLVKQRVREQQNRRFAEQQQRGASLQLCQGQGGQPLPFIQINGLEVGGDGWAEPAALHFPHQAAHIESAFRQPMVEVHLNKEV